MSAGINFFKCIVKQAYLVFSKDGELILETSKQQMFIDMGINPQKDIIDEESQKNWIPQESYFDSQF